jgi:predicted O-linked N-acetylglucosamine transferase (SPINDLY family)
LTSDDGEATRFLMPNVDDQRKLQTAFLQHQAGNVTAAANLYKDLITRNPQNSQAIHYLGVIEAGFGNIEQAKDLMARSVSMQPKNVQFAENFGSLLFQLSDYDLAIQVCNRALRRVAPIQVNYLGYLGTMGAGYIDYIIADRVVIPETQYDFYAEKIVYLPNSFQPTDRQRPISDKKFTRADVVLPQDGFVFCCFNTNYKITPDVYDLWMRILKQVPGSVLWLVAEGPTVERNLRNEAAVRGVSGERLIFAQRMPLAEHQARLQLAGLFLDTLPYNAGATATDMLWSGLPVLTRIGDTFVGRMAASVLNAIHLPELIAATPQAYEQMAIDLATHPQKLTAIKNKLAANRLTTPLFDMTLFTKHIEAAYSAMHERYQAELSPDHIVIPN